jgi:Cysteine rich repeat
MLIENSLISRPLSSLILATMLAAPVAAAEQATGLPPEASNPAVQTAWGLCKPDIAKFCSDVAPGGGRIVRCLVGHASQISPACRDGMWTAKAALGR